MKKNYLFTSESVSEGHPDKVCDRISDMVVDTYLSSGDPQTRVACETLTTTNKVVLMEDAIKDADIVVTATGNKDIVTADHMRDMKDRAILCNIGHFDNEIQTEALQNYKSDEIKPQVREVEFPDGKKILLLSEGRLVNLGNATGHPSFVMSASFTNQVLAQLELWKNSKNYENKVYVLPKHLDEKVASLHLKKVGAKLTELTDKQAEYIGVSKQGPFKDNTYRY